MRRIKYELDVPAYEGEGIRTEWLDDSRVFVDLFDDGVYIKANKDGLITLAMHLLTMASNEITSGMHLHYDVYGGLEEGSIELLIEKL